MLKFAYPYQTEETNKKLLSSSGSPEQIIPSLREIGYDGIELLVRNPNKVNHNQLDNLIHKTNLEIAAISTGPMVADDGLVYTSSKQEVRELAIQRTMDAIQWGNHFDCPITIGKLRGQIDYDNEAVSWGYMEEALYQVLDYAEKVSVSILIEPQNKTQINNLTHTGETLSFISRFTSPMVGIMLDTLHMYKEANKADFERLILQAENKLEFIHLTDSDRLPPGDGYFNIAHILTILQSLDNCPYISLEIQQQNDSLKMAEKSLTYLQKVLSLQKKGDEHDN